MELIADAPPSEGHPLAENDFVPEMSAFANRCPKSKIVTRVFVFDEDMIRTIPRPTLTFNNICIWNLWTNTFVEISLVTS